MRDSRQARHSLRIFFTKKIKQTPSVSVVVDFFSLFKRKRCYLSEQIFQGEAWSRYGIIVLFVSSFLQRQNKHFLCQLWISSIRSRGKADIHVSKKILHRTERLSGLVELWVFTHTHTHTRSSLRSLGL